MMWSSSRSSRIRARLVVDLGSVVVIAAASGYASDDGSMPGGLSKTCNARLMIPVMTWLRSPQPQKGLKWIARV